MRKLILFFAVATGALMTGCDPEGNSWQWWIKNSTDQTLKLTYFSYVPRIPAYVTTTISPGDSIVLYKIGLEKSHFDNYFQKSAELSGEDTYWQILSEYDEVLKTWTYSDKGLPGQLFFEESSWSFNQRPGQTAFIMIEYSWTFDILQEDIEP